MCNGCAGNAAHNVSIASAPAAPLPCLGLQDRLPAAPAQLPAQQPARRGPAQHRPVIVGMGGKIPQSGKADASQLFHGKMCNFCGKVCMNEAACLHLTHRMLYACLIRCLCVAAEALVPTHAQRKGPAASPDSAAEQCARRGCTAGSPARAQPGASWATACYLQDWLVT